MAERNRLLLETLDQLRLALEPAQPHLIGGLAVHLRCAKLVDELGLDPDLLPPYDPRRWPTVVRATRDIDLVVAEPQLERARAILVGARFERSESMTPPPERYRRGQAIVDLIPRSDEPEPASRPGLEEAVALLRDEHSRVEGWATAAAGALVVYKALARRPRDLIDVARIALLDRERGDARAEIADLRSRLRPAFGRALRDLEDRFARPDGRACGYFFHEVAAGLGFDVEGLEDPIREQASSAVTELLREA